MEGRERVRDAFPLRADRTVDVHHETMASRGEHLVLHRVTIGERDGNASREMLTINRVDAEGRHDLRIALDSHDLSVGLEELRRLYLDEVRGSPAEAPCRDLQRFGNHLRDGRYDLAQSVAHPDYRIVDHRELGWPELDFDGLGDRLGSFAALRGELALFISRFHRLEPAGRVWGFTQRLTSQDGADQESRGIMVDVVDAATGLGIRSEQFDAHELDRALARYDEMAAEVWSDEVSNMASRTCGAANLWARERRADFVAEWLAPDVAIHDATGDVLVVGSERLADLDLARSHGIGVEQRRVMAVRGERLSLVELLDAVAGFHRIAVEELDEEGAIARIVHFDLDALDAAFERLHRLYSSTIGGAVADVAVAATEFASAALAGDGPALTPLLSKDFRAVDHREFGFEESDRAGYIAAVETVASLPGSLVTNEILRLTEEGVVSTGSMWVISDGGDLTEAFPAIRLMMYADDRFWRVERFEIDDRDAALARFDELVRLGPDATAARSVQPPTE